MKSQKASTDSAKLAVTLALGLVGVMAFWLGMMRDSPARRFLDAMARFAKPVLSRLFPDVPAEHPAMSMMVMNMTSNMLGLGNAATPFGLKAMLELDKLNKTKGTASNAMCLFLAINTSGVAVLPLGMVAIRADLGSTMPGAIIATTCSLHFSRPRLPCLCFHFLKDEILCSSSSPAAEDVARREISMLGMLRRRLMQPRVRFSNQSRYGADWRHCFCRGVSLCICWFSSRCGCW